MENLLVWMLVFAGATIGLLGTFLIASERELKKKRREATELAAIINADHGTDESNSPETTKASAELITRNQELADQVVSLSNRLQASQSASESLAAVQHELTTAQLQNAALRKSNQQLEKEFALAKSQLDTGHSQLEQSRSDHEVVAARYAQFERENADLRQELEQSRRRIVALERDQMRCGDFESRESLMKEQQQKRDREIAELNDELVACRNNLRELETTRAQLRESEALRKQFVDDNQRLQKEISAWQERLADSEEQRGRLSTVRHLLESLKAKQTAFSESHRQLEADLEALARFVDDAASPIINLETNSVTNGQDNFRSELNRSAASADAAVPFGTSAAIRAAEGPLRPGVKKRRFGIFSVIVAVTVGASVIGGWVR